MHGLNTSASRRPSVEWKTTAPGKSQSMQMCSESCAITRPSLPKYRPAPLRNEMARHLCCLVTRPYTSAFENSSVSRLNPLTLRRRGTPSQADVRHSLMQCRLVNHSTLSRPSPHRCQSWSSPKCLASRMETWPHSKPGRMPSSLTLAIFYSRSQAPRR